MANQQSDDINVFFPKALTQLICNYVPLCMCGCHAQPVVGCEIPSLCGVEDCVRCGECKIKDICKSCEWSFRCFVHLYECTFCGKKICGGCVEIYQRWNFPNICNDCADDDTICKFCAKITVDNVNQFCFFCLQPICSQCVTLQQTDTSGKYDIPGVCASCQYMRRANSDTSENAGELR
jgi:hypothetical protein